MLKCDECNSKTETLYHRWADNLWVCANCVLKTFDSASTQGSGLKIVSHKHDFSGGPRCAVCGRLRTLKLLRRVLGDE